jgi:2-keto-3-deoxy-6-phosphogluconate aldolase
VVGEVEFTKTIPSRDYAMQFMSKGGVNNVDFNNYLELPAVLCIDGTWLGK